MADYIQLTSRTMRSQLRDPVIAKEALTKVCTYCRVPQGPCKTKSGGLARSTHMKRLKVALADHNAGLTAHMFDVKWVTQRITAQTTTGGSISLTPTQIWGEWTGISVPGVYTGTAWTRARVWNDWVTENTYLSTTNATTLYGNQWNTVRWNDNAARVMQQWIRVEQDAERADMRRASDIRADERAALITPEMQALRDQNQARREELSRRQLAVERQAKGAQQRAMNLLEMILTEEEGKYWDEHRRQRLLVRAQSGRMYIIRTYEGAGVHGNVVEVDEHGCTLAVLCVAPGMRHDVEGQTFGMPTADGWVGQYLFIKHNEEELRRKANYSRQQPCQEPNVPILRARDAA